tara:strand:+ start:24372 stop:24914 length:543 start_codon:yes stop_codon:yes gene_type:complete
MTNLTIVSKEIRQRGGLYSLNDLHKASQTTVSKKPSEWVRQKQIHELIAELESESGNSRFEIIHSVKGGKFAGTYACKELVYAYAMWISPKFHLQVIRAFDELQSQKQLPARDPLEFQRILIIIEDGYTVGSVALSDKDFITSWDKLPKLIMDGQRANPAQLLAISQACNRQLAKRIGKF